MRRTFHAARLRTQRGAVAVEAAIVFTVLVLFATLPSIYWAIYFYRYSAAQKGLHHAALYLSTAPKVEMEVEGPDGNPAALTLAQNILDSEMAGMRPPDIEVLCGYRQASGNVSWRFCTTTNNRLSSQALTRLSVAISMNYISPLTGGESDLWIAPTIEVPYVGN
ncbi:MAG TPA: hypothetical protein DCX52_01100 [Massilia sp.]|nr:hypothetical protein [Massilia sp.]